MYGWVKTNIFKYSNITEIDHENIFYLIICNYLKTCIKGTRQVCDLLHWNVGFWYQALPGHQATAATPAAFPQVCSSVPQSSDILPPSALPVTVKNRRKNKRGEVIH